jgi:hypothetical protein
LPRGVVPLSRQLRLLFEEYGGLSPYEAYKELCVKRKSCKSYTTITVIFYLLKRLGLIRIAELEPSSRGGFDKTVYEMTPGLENHPCWDDPRCCVKKEWCSSMAKRIYYWDSGIAPTLHKVVNLLRKRGKL